MDNTTPQNNQPVAQPQNLTPVSKPQPKGGPQLKAQPGVSPDILYVQVSSPEKTLFDGEASSLSSFNDQGPFDILPQHENFISVIHQSVVVFDLAHKPQEFLLRNGVMRVSANRVDVFIGF